MVRAAQDHWFVQTDGGGGLPGGGGVAKLVGGARAVSCGPAPRGHLLSSVDLRDGPGCFFTKRRWRCRIGDEVATIVVDGLGPQPKPVLQGAISRAIRVPA